MRIRVVLAAVLVVAGCGGPSGDVQPSVPALNSPPPTPTTPTPTETPTETPSAPTAKVADTACTRVNQSLVQTTLGAPVVRIEPKALPAEFGLPTYDVCQLGLSTTPSGPVLRIGTSVFPAGARELAAARASYDASKQGPAKPVNLGQGGFGASRFVVFRYGARLYKVSGPAVGMAKYVLLAREVISQLSGLPEPEPLVTRAECDRGSGPAAKILGAPASVRRDGESASGQPVCGWVTATAALSTSARIVADAEKVIAPIRKAPTSMAVPLGDEGYVNTTTGRATLRIGPDKIVDLVPLPPGKADKDDMVALALAMTPVYR